MTSMLVEFDILVKQSGIYVRGFVLILHLVYLTGLNELGMFQFRVYVRGVLNQLERSMLVGFVF